MSLNALHCWEPWPVTVTDTYQPLNTWPLTHWYHAESVYIYTTGECMCQFIELYFFLLYLYYAEK